MPKPHAPVHRAFALVLGLLLVAACNDDTSTPQPLPQGKFTGDLECLLLAEAAADLRECVIWSYDQATGTLYLVHENACLNCCPESAPRVIWDGAALVLEEDEAGGLCDCLCLYDLSYTFESVAPAAIALVTRCGCPQSGEECLQGVLDLAAATSGAICVERTRYPWL